VGSKTIGMQDYTAFHERPPFVTAAPGGVPVPSGTLGSRNKDSDAWYSFRLPSWVRVNELFNFLRKAFLPPYHSSSIIRLKWYCSTMVLPRVSLLLPPCISRIKA